jgi:transposase
VRDLPNDVETLKRLLTEKDAALQAIRGELRSHKLEIERLRLELARLRRMQFGRSSEALNDKIAQLELTLEEFEAAEAAEPFPIGRTAGGA